MSKITNDVLTPSGTGCFIAVPIWQQWASKGQHTTLCYFLGYFVSAYAEIEIRIPSSCLSVCLSHYCGISTNRQDFTEVLSLSLFSIIIKHVFSELKRCCEIPMKSPSINRRLIQLNGSINLLNHCYYNRTWSFAVHGDKKTERNIRYLIVGIQYFFSIQDVDVDIGTGFENVWYRFGFRCDYTF